MAFCAGRGELNVDCLTRAEGARQLFPSQRQLVSKPRLIVFPDETAGASDQEETFLGGQQESLTMS